MAKKIEILENTLLKLLVRRGTNQDRKAITLSEGELGYTTDTNRLYVGDGSTEGGVLVGNKFLGQDNEITTFTDANIGDLAYDSDNRALYAYMGPGPASAIENWQLISSVTDEGTGNINVGINQIRPDAAGAGIVVTAGQLAIDCNGIKTNKVESCTGVMQLPNKIQFGAGGSSYEYTLPARTNSAGKFLVGDNNGNLSWSNDVASDVITYFNSNDVPVPVGTIAPFASLDAVMNNWVICDGSSKSTTAYPDLFDVIGYSYGGSGGTFNVPNLINKTIYGTTADPSGELEYGLGGGGGMNLVMKGSGYHTPSSNGTWKAWNANTLLDTSDSIDYILVQQRWATGQSPNTRSEFRDQAGGRQVSGNSIHAGGGGDIEYNTIQFIAPVMPNGDFEVYTYSGGLALSDVGFSLIGYFTSTGGGTAPIDAKAMVYAIKAVGDPIVDSTMTVRSPLIAKVNGANQGENPFNPLTNAIELSMLESNEIEVTLDDLQTISLKSNTAVSKGYLEASDVNTFYAGSLPLAINSTSRITKLTYNTVINGPTSPTFSEDGVDGHVFIDWQEKKIKMVSVRREGNAIVNSHTYESSSVEADGLIMFDSDGDAGGVTWPTPEGIGINWSSRTITALPFFSIDSSNTPIEYKCQYVFEPQTGGQGAAASGGGAAAWVSFEDDNPNTGNTGDMTLRGGYNVSRVEKTGNGYYTVWFRNPMPTVYAMTGSAKPYIDTTRGAHVDLNPTPAEPLLTDRAYIRTISTDGDPQPVSPQLVTLTFFDNFGSTDIHTYSTGWVNTDGSTAVANNALLNFSHNLGSDDLTFTVYAADDASGTNSSIVGELDDRGFGWQGAYVHNITTTSFDIQLAQDGYLTDGSNPSIAWTGKYLKVVAQGGRVIGDDDFSLQENGYQKLPSGLIMQWGKIKPSSRRTNVTLPTPFTNKCFNVTVSYGADFTDSVYDDNSQVWGGYPGSTTDSANLETIVIMSNLRKNASSDPQYVNLYWQAIGF